MPCRLASSRPMLVPLSDVHVSTFPSGGSPSKLLPPSALVALFLRLWQTSLIRIWTAPHVGYGVLMDLNQCPRNMGRFTSETSHSKQARGPWTSDLASTSQMLRFQTSASMPTLCWGWNQGLVHARQALYPLSSVPAHSPACASRDRSAG